MAEINREILLPYMEAYLPYLEKQEKRAGGRLLSNAKEDYKRSIPIKAAQILNTENWTEAEIGTGVIRDRIYKSLQIHKNLINYYQISSFKDKVNNNLVHNEEILYLFFHDHKEEECFERICGIFGRKYDIVAYLYFINNPKRYLPVKPSFFDSIFKRIQLDFQTSNHCSWDNYQEFLSIVNQVRELLREFFNEPEIDILDAHSFLWTIDQGVLGVGDSDRQTQKEDADSVLGIEDGAGDSAVYHKEYGTGSIVKISNDNVYVRFGDKTYIFQYPEAFDRGYLWQ